MQLSNCSHPDTPMTSLPNPFTRSASYLIVRSISIILTHSGSRRKISTCLGQYFPFFVPPPTVARPQNRPASLFCSACIILLISIAHQSRQGAPLRARRCALKPAGAHGVRRPVPPPPEALHKGEKILQFLVDAL